jgi:transposase
MAAFEATRCTHTLVAVDDVGVKLGEKTVEATGRGHASALRWAHRKFGAGLLERDLMAARQRVVRVPPTLMARSRVSARTSYRRSGGGTRCPARA